MNETQPSWRIEGAGFRITTLEGQSELMITEAQMATALDDLVAEKLTVEKPEHNTDQTEDETTPPTRKSPAY